MHHPPSLVDLYSTSLLLSHTPILCRVVWPLLEVYLLEVSLLQFSKNLIKKIVIHGLTYGITIYHNVFLLPDNCPFTAPLVARGGTERSTDLPSNNIVVVML